MASQVYGGRSFINPPTPACEPTRSNLFTFTFTFTFIFIFIFESEFMNLSLSLSLYPYLNL